MKRFRTKETTTKDSDIDVVSDHNNKRKLLSASEASSDYSGDIKMEPKQDNSVQSNPVQLEDLAELKEKVVGVENNGNQPIIKQEMETDEEEDPKQENARPMSVFAERREYLRQIFKNRRKGSVRAKEKRIRHNRYLRKTLIPKNALTSLNEMKGVQVGDFRITDEGSFDSSGNFTAQVTVNHKTYVSKGYTKVAAKNAVCEQAIRDYIVKKLQRHPRNGLAVAGKNKSNDENGCVEEKEGQEDSDQEEVPILSLASFALYKLFAEWEKEGYFVPEMHPHEKDFLKSTKEERGLLKKKKKPTRTEKKLPDNWSSLHPASLLCMMRPGAVYNNDEIEGTSSSSIGADHQTIKVNVDGQSFSGSGRSKKHARREAAANACNTLFGTNYDLATNN